MPELQKASETLQDVIDAVAALRVALAARLKLIDYEHRLLAKGKDLTADGIQWCAGTEGADASFTSQAGVQAEYETAFTMLIDPGIDGTLLWLECGLTIGLLSNNDNSGCKWRWRIRPEGGAWADLRAEVTETDIDIAEKERTSQGYAILANVGSVPFELKLELYSTTDTDTITARVKSSSYVRAVYAAS